MSAHETTTFSEGMDDLCFTCAIRRIIADPDTEVSMHTIPAPLPNLTGYPDVKPLQCVVCDEEL